MDEDTGVIMAADSPPERFYVCFNENEDCYIAYTAPDDNDPEYIRADLVPTWRTDIENAPKDGTPVLMYNGDWGAKVCKWEDTGIDYRTREVEYEWVWACDSGTTNNYYSTISHPEMWMPIPKGYE